MNALCTSFPLDLRRIARSRAARALVCVLALVLAATNVMAAAMPVADGGAHGATAAVLRLSHAHCTDHGAPASHAAHVAHPGHGADCPCCGKACACMHACDALALAMPPALPIRSQRDFATPAPRGGAAVEAPLLRPPIA